MGNNAAEAQDLLRAMAENLGREVHVCINRAAVAESDANLQTSTQKQEEEPDDLYEFTMEDYARIMANKKEEIFLKTRKIREAEAAARRARITKAVIRVQFPDHYVLEATFNSSDTISTLCDFMKKAVARPNLPFYLYTTPPKQQLQGLDKDLYTAGLAPGAVVYFSYDLSKGITEEMQAAMEEPYLRSDIMALRDLHLLKEPVVKAEELLSCHAPATQEITKPDLDPKPRKASIKPKWMKM